MNRICTICARGGSKGVKNKNLKKINDIPLIVYSIKHAQKSTLFNHIAVSSDSDEILEIAKKNGVEILIKRPLELARDDSPKIPAMRHAVTQAEALTGLVYDTIVDLDATSPLRKVEDILNVVEILEKRGIGNIITGTKAHRSPYFNLVEIDEEGHIGLSKKSNDKVFRRQDSPTCYDLNASIYAWTRDAFFINNMSLFNDDTFLYEMPQERSIDIDSELDFFIVEFILNNELNH